MFPEDSLQNVFGNPDWWTQSSGNTLSRGSLVYAFVRHADFTPLAFEPVGRVNPTEHCEANVKVTPIKVNQPLRQIPLPVAAMPLYENEIWTACRSKGRPCLVISTECNSVKSKATKGMPNSKLASCVLVAPYYGADRKSSYNSEFVERIRHCNYPQFVWDVLPIKNGKESVLRLDQAQPIGSHHDSYRHTGYKLSTEAMNVIDELFTYLIWGGLPEKGDIITFRELIAEFLN